MKQAFIVIDGSFYIFGIFKLKLKNKEKKNIFIEIFSTKKEIAIKLSGFAYELYFRMRTRTTKNYVSDK